MNGRRATSILSRGRLRALPPSHASGVGPPRMRLTRPRASLATVGAAAPELRGRPRAEHLPRVSSLALVRRGARERRRTPQARAAVPPSDSRRGKDATVPSSAEPEQPPTVFDSRRPKPRR
jgi:hypothetical protein